MKQPIPCNQWTHVKTLMELFFFAACHYANLKQLEQVLLKRSPQILFNRLIVSVTAIDLNAFHNSKTAKQSQMCH